MSIASEYARLLTELSKSAQVADTEEKFITLLKARGHLKLLPSILREYERMIAKERSTNEPILTIAHASDQAAALEAAAKEMGAHMETPKIVVDEKQIGGWRLQSRSTLIDRTYKRALLDLYRKMTA